MLKKFTLKNYKNFKDEISIDFENTAGYQFSTDCITDGIISKMLIYGRNATGKTNLGKALIDIYITMFGGRHYIDTGIFLNADSIDKAADFSYEFRFESNELVYRYARFSNQELRDEELIIDGKTIFSCDFENDKFDFKNLEYINAETASIDRYLQSMDVGDEEEIQEPKLPFLRWLISNVALGNDSILIKLANYVRRMLMVTAGNGMLKMPRRMNGSFYELLEDSNRLKDLEDFLNEMGIECKLILKKLPDGQRELYFWHEKLVPFYETASSGTLALVDLYRRLIPKSWDPSFIYLDEFDAFYHYEMAEKVIKFFKRRYPKCQIIMTSHNTNLMTNRLMRPDCLFILSRVGTLTALCNATERELREGHNLEKMYISGEFDRYE
ncbi:ATP-binding protein [Hominisplanchenecus murintestinalis]|uniref:ATP-binding protein n=1 Tax=Hominisplanchenecus murintestinalis TaxID=2941517 RepID=A0AC61R3J7_9FIRM|nr:ATP-binding protein [Hominisplanchenecus murintestinalis]TGY00853.1 ATP-binding protein [Hominisplanchenecus murintestinalis]